MATMSGSDRRRPGPTTLIDGGKNVVDGNAESVRARGSYFSPVPAPIAFAVGGVSARKTPDRSGGRSSMTVFGTVSTPILS